MVVRMYSNLITNLTMCLPHGKHQLKTYKHIQTENQQKNTNIKQHITSDGLNRYIKNIPCQNSRLHTSSMHETFSRIDYMLGHKKVSIKLVRVKSHQASFPTSGMKLEVNYKGKKTAKKTNT